MLMRFFRVCGKRLSSDHVIDGEKHDILFFKLCLAIPVHCRHIAMNARLAVSREKMNAMSIAMGIFWAFCWMPKEGQAFSAAPTKWQRAIHQTPTSSSTSICQLTNDSWGNEKEYSNERDDDGWGSSSGGSDANDKQSQLRELQQLQAKSQTTTSSQPQSIAGEEQDRDLFIPIFALVSLAGLFGTYGYEMVRLYLRGELYLPF